MLSDLDTSVGAVLAKLEEHDIADQTLVIFLSDNGGITPELTSSNAPLRSGKMHLYEGGIRVPMMMRWPGKIPAGSVYKAPVSSLDIYATAAELAGDVPAIKRSDGVPLLPFLSGESSNPPHPELFWEYNDQGAIRQMEWKAIRPRKRRVGTLQPSRRHLGVEQPGQAHYPERLKDLVDRWKVRQAEWAAEAGAK